MRWWTRQVILSSHKLEFTEFLQNTESYGTMRTFLQLMNTWLGLLLQSINRCDLVTLETRIIPQVLLALHLNPFLTSKSRTTSFSALQNAVLAHKLSKPFNLVVLNFSVHKKHLRCLFNLQVLGFCQDSLIHWVWHLIQESEF